MADPVITLTAVDKTKAAFASVATGFDRLKSQAEALVSPFARVEGAIAALGAVGAVVSFKAAVDAADDLNKLSQKIGISVESLSTLRFAADLADVPLESLGQGIKKLSVNMAEVQRGTGEAAEAFKALRINVESAPGSLKVTEDVLLEIADSFAKFEDGANKTALAVKLFGKSGSDLIPFLNQGRAGIEQLRKEFERLGGKISGETARQAEQFNDDLSALSESAKRLGRQMAESLLPGLTLITEQMRLAAQQGGLWAAALAGVREAFIQVFLAQKHVAGAGATQASINQAITEQIALIERLETTEARRGTRGALDRPRQIAAAKEYLEVLKQQSIAQQTLDQFNTPGGLNPPVTKTQAPALFDSDAAKKAQQKEEQRIKALRAFEKLAQDANDERTKKAFDGAVKEGEALDKESEALDKLKQSYLDLIDPVEKYRRQLEEVNKVESRGRLTSEQAEMAREKIYEQIRELSTGTQKAKSLAEELGLTFSSAFEDAVVGGKKFSDVLKGIEQDIIRIVIRQQVTKPLADSLGEIFKPSGGGGAGAGFLSNIFGSLFGLGKGFVAMAEGGDVSAGAPYLIGERGPELFVPDTGGTIVPNGKFGSMVYSPTFVLQGQPTRDTQQQLALSAYRGARRAWERNG